MVVELGAEGVQNADQVNGSDYPAVGDYHVVLKDFEEKFSEKTQEMYTHFEWEILAGTMPGQEGKIMPVNINTTESKDLEKLKRIALVLGLLNYGDPKRGVDFNQGIGRQAVISVSEFKTDDGMRTTIANFGFGYFELNHPKMARVPKNAEALAMLGMAPQPLTPPQPVAHQQPIPQQPVGQPQQQAVMPQQQPVQQQAPPATQQSNAFAGL